MAYYFYTAKSFAGEIKSGLLEARDKHQLAQILRKEGYLLISAELKERAKKEKASFLKKLRRISLAEKIFFVRNLAIMVSTGVSLSKALNLLSTQTKSKKFETALLDVSGNIIKGKNFSDSLANWPDIFSDFFISMVKVGEEAGTLEEVLKILTKQLEKEYQLKSKVKQALLYPIVIVCAMLGIGFLMLVTVVPKLSELFNEMGVELPFTTKIVITSGVFLTEKWYLVILAAFLLLLSFFRFKKTKKGKKIIDGFLLKVPIISSIIKKANSAFTVRSLSSLISSGVPVVRSLEIVSETIGNSYFKKPISEAIEKVKKGEKLSESLKPYSGFYPFGTIQMIEVGEETGETTMILSKLADFFEEEVTNATQNLTAVIEPILMLFVGAIVGFFAVSMVQPMYSMLGTVK